MKNYTALNGMIDNQKNVLYAAFDKGYKHGVKDGKEEVWDARYEKGLNDAWDCARKIYDMTFEVRDTIFSTHDTGAIFHPYSASEAIAIIKEYEEKRNEETQEEDAEVKIGDEIKYGNRLCVATRVGDGYIIVVYDNGDGGVLSKEKCQKTGRCFPQIAEIFNRMQEVKE